MSDIYIGARSSTEIAKILGRSPAYLNEGMSKLVRSACLLLGIKKTEQRRRLNFYVVSHEDYKRLTDDKHRLINNIKGEANVHHLVKIDKDKFSEVIDRVNAKHGGTGMDNATYKRYQTQMSTALSRIIEVTGADQNIKKKSQQLAPNPYKAGDIIAVRDYDVPREHRPRTWAYLRVRWAGKRHIELDRLGPKYAEHGFWPNTQSIRHEFKDVITWGLPKDGSPMYSGQPHGHFVPLRGNEDQLTWYPVGGYDRDTEQHTHHRYQWTRYARYVPGDRRDRHSEGHYESRANPDAELGYFYNYEGSYD